MEEKDIQKIAVEAIEEFAREEGLTASFERLRHVDLFNWEFAFEADGEPITFYLQIFANDPPESAKGALKETLKRRLDLRKSSS